jgi:predicted membrane-bound spermidine synthase
MIVELTGGKMLAPFYGTSIYVWASTLSITLGGLALGYFIGGRLSKMPYVKRRQRLFFIISVSCFFVIVMPFWAKTLMSATLDLSFLTGLVISELCFLLLPVTGMGIVSPMIISIIDESDASMEAAGFVYAISTCGGVLATLLTGFWFIPLVGISIPCIAIGVLLLIVSVFVLKPGKKAPALLLLVAIPAFFYVKATRETSSDKFELVYYSEGILGQIKVIDFKTTKDGKPITTRSLLVNHNWQTWIDKDHPSFSFLYYTRFSNAIIKTMAEKSRALLIGLGGGTVARQLEQKGIDYDAVEIDGRLPELAEQYFGLEEKGNLIIDDGRHFINRCDKKYDLIIIDALLGENVPSHLLSLECFEKLKALLNTSGRIFIEFDGIEKGETGKAQKMLYNTITKAGFNCQTFSSVPGAYDSDIMYLAGLGTVNTEGINIDSDAFYDYKGNIDKFAISLNNPTLKIVTDDHQVLDYLLRKKMAYLRNDILKKENKAFLENDFFFYY